MTKKVAIRKGRCYDNDKNGFFVINCFPVIRKIGEGKKCRCGAEGEY